MAASIPNLRVLDRSSAVRELDLASELFHRINRIIPQDQELLVIPPDCLRRLGAGDRGPVGGGKCRAARGPAFHRRAATDAEN